MPQMYCLACYYDLRGLPENRCPECGRAFSPANPASYSPSPHPERLHKLVRQAADLLTDALKAVEPADPAARSLAGLQRQVGRLSAENWTLRQQVAGLTQVLLDNGLVDPAELAAAVDRAAVTPDVPIVDDTGDEPGDEPATAELLDLRHAVERHDGVR